MKTNILRILLFATVFFLGFSGPVVVFILVAVAYTLLYAGVELIVLAAAIDAYYGYERGDIYLYTLCATVLVFFVQWLKPRLWVYNQ